MKTLRGIFFVLLFAARVAGADPISIGEFKKITNADERRKLIDQAPSGQKEELERIDLHLALLARWGGEAGFKTHKEACIARARGFVCLVPIFDAYVNIRSSYMAGVLITDEKAGMKLEQLQEVEKKLTEENRSVEKWVSTVDSLVFNLAVSPEALELEKRAEKMIEKLSSRTITDGSTPFRLITKEERMEVDRQMKQIYEEIKKLPKLTPEQAQREYDAFPDEKVSVQ
jgi:hypothetical protein